MMILTETGEIGVHLPDGETLVLRPSLYAMSRLGSPKEIVETYALVMHPEPFPEQLVEARFVIANCCEHDTSSVFGYGTESGMASDANTLTIARSLLDHGITGSIDYEEDRPKKDGEYTNEFIARDHAAACVAHLGMSEREAWDTTMTTLVSALRSKYPPVKQPGDNAPTKKEHDETMAWFDKIQKARGN